VRRALPLLLMLAACSLREPRVSAASCANAGQCSRTDVCFLGECRAPAANLSVVRVEVRPPGGSQFGLKEQQLDLGQGVLNDFTLRVPLAAAGTVKQTQDGANPTPLPVAGAVITLTDSAPVIPDRVEQIVSVTDAAGNYSARVPQGLWKVLVEAPAPLPPFRGPVLDTSSPSVDFVLPPPSAFPHLTGVVTVDGGTTPVAGVSVTAVDAEGTAISAPAISQADGGYTLVLPPAAVPSPVTLQIAPPPDTDAGVPLAAGLDPFPTYAVPHSASIDLQLPAVTTLSGTVRDSIGDPVPSARVYVRSVNMPWTLARSIAASATGAYSFSLRAGSYLLQAVPPADANTPALSAQLSVSAPVALPVDLTCPQKVRRFGQVLAPGGRPVGANYQIVATRLSDGLVTTRTAYTVPTDSNGIYHVVADAGRWRFEVVPPAGAVLPRKIVQVDLDATLTADVALPAVEISPPLEVVGTVKGTGAPGSLETPIADAMLNFFSLDSTGRSVFLGGARTDPQGRYTAILPDVKQPGMGP
jgi:hypothetical protein